MKSYPDLTGEKRRSFLPPDLQDRLLALRAQMESDCVRKEDVVFCVDGFGALAAETVRPALDELRRLAALYAHSDWPWMEKIALPRSRDRATLAWVQGTEYLFTAHGNGYIREAALQKIDQAIPSAFWVIAIIYRLNDWVSSVRLAASDCIRRCFPLTSAEVIAEAACQVIFRRHSWRRGVSEFAVLDPYFREAEVIQSMVQRIAARPTGPNASILACALQYPEVDGHLMYLARHAAQPAVAALALNILIRGEARWPDGMERQWIDKTAGRFRWVPKFSHRRAQLSVDIPNTIRIAARDKRFAVRRVAMQSLVDRRDLWPDFGDVIELLRRDRNGTIREGAGYIHKHRQDDESGAGR